MNALPAFGTRSRVYSLDFGRSTSLCWHLLLTSFCYVPCFYFFLSFPKDTGVNCLSFLKLFGGVVNILNLRMKTPTTPPNIDKVRAL